MVGLGDGNKQNKTMLSIGTSQRADFAISTPSNPISGM